MNERKSALLTAAGLVVAHVLWWRLADAAAERLVAARLRRYSHVPDAPSIPPLRFERRKPVS